MATYFEKLKDPRWQKKRLEALQIADFHCQMCGDGTSTLHVHHKQYFKGRDPWEYDAMQLAVLCEDCHAAHHAEDDELHLVGSYLPLDGPWCRGSAASLIAGFSNIYPVGDVSDKFAHHAGALAQNVFCHFSAITEPELLELANMSLEHGFGMLDALRAYVASVNGERN
jgi:hypothetical protein